MFPLSTCIIVKDIVVKVVEGDARNVLCDAVEKPHASILVLGSHGYGKHLGHCKTLFSPILKRVGVGFSAYSLLTEDWIMILSNNNDCMQDI
ncbi:unnamed protein product [Trifolium pratense]|uniref:Uncharacterized protein n=1 Tax=Trifolium pratense TaxID=57577 RepID=A0ACB0MA24_TRIPR|nr:unnamed protein product [Trifolium pratense]